MIVYYLVVLLYGLVLLIQCLYAVRSFDSDPVSLEKRVCIALFKLASCSEYRVVGIAFGVSVTTVHRCLVSFCYAVSKDRHSYIQFPSNTEAAEIADR